MIAAARRQDAAPALAIRHLGGAFGSQIIGLSLNETLDEAVMDQLRAAFLAYSVPVFPG